MECAEWEFAVPMTLTAQDVADILTAAFEGGIVYWAVVRLPKGAKTSRPYLAEALAFDHQALVVRDVEGDASHLLTAEALQRGLIQYIQERGWTGDIGNIDADEADAIVQFSLFQEVIYG